MLAALILLAKVLHVCPCVHTCICVHKCRAQNLTIDGTTQVLSTLLFKTGSLIGLALKEG